MKLFELMGSFNDLKGFPIRYTKLFEKKHPVTYCNFVFSLTFQINL